MTARRLERQTRCAICRRAIRDHDRVTRLPRRGWAHLACATAAKAATP